MKLSEYRKFYELNLELAEACKRYLESVNVRVESIKIAQIEEKFVIVSYNDGKRDRVQAIGREVFLEDLGGNCRSCTSGRH